MNTLTIPQPVSVGRRVLNVVKLNTVNPWTAIVMPWMILGFIFLVNYLIWWIIFSAVAPEDRADAAEGLQYSGASWFIFIYMMVVAIQTINLTFPLALGYGVTRRDFWLGTSLTNVLLAAMFSIGLTILSIIETATNGWGLGGRMFTTIWFGETWPERLFVIFTLLVFFLFFGSAIATVYVRWKANGVAGFFIALTLVLVGLAALVTFSQSWPAVGNFFVTSGVRGTVAWSYIVTVVAAVTGFLFLRRATPKS